MPEPADSAMPSALSPRGVAWHPPCVPGDPPIPYLTSCRRHSGANGVAVQWAGVSRRCLETFPFAPFSPRPAPILTLAPLGGRLGARSGGAFSCDAPWPFPGRFGLIHGYPSPPGCRRELVPRASSRHERGGRAQQCPVHPVPCCNPTGPPVAATATPLPSARQSVTLLSPSREPRGVRVCTLVSVRGVGDGGGGVLLIRCAHQPTNHTRIQS